MSNNTVRALVPIPSDADEDARNKLDADAHQQFRQKAAVGAFRVVRVERDDVVQYKIDGKWQFESQINVIIPKDTPTRQAWYYTAHLEPSPVVAVLGNESASEAVDYAYRCWPGFTGRVIAITDRVGMARLHGNQGTPFVKVPNLEPVLWHNDVHYHVRCGRIVIVPTVTDTQNGTEHKS